MHSGIDLSMKLQAMLPTNLRKMSVLQGRIMLLSVFWKSLYVRVSLNTGSSVHAFSRSEFNAWLTPVSPLKQHCGCCSYASARLVKQVSALFGLSADTHALLRSVAAPDAVIPVFAQV